MKKIAVLVGSLRRDSINRRLAEALARLAEDRLEFDFVAVGEVPMYNEDLWADIPASIKRMKRQVEQADGVLFVSPEYNRSFTAVLKNAIDWGTRPYGQNSFAGKPGAVVGTSPGAIGTAVGQSQLKSVLNAAHVIVMGQPEIYLTWKAELFDEDGGITHESTRSFLQKWVRDFEGWIERTSQKK
ncbi:NAD(P)H-dependent FMN reductase [Rhizobium mongolense subsp. loessense]|uniref:NAD(P)H-dependent FMN reductase n=1 Tax=Rhizobium mongolense subsp. loessense TaxID=158890 RepID=A0A1G4S4X5_9HYPH|nr:NAD(P)H-dependent oxidoreductase [Rhizobium mongolense]SCW63675.1 NAD(P)H-dependent FMN reductase [Rhizobium mongolense subsp. loessense]